MGLLLQRVGVAGVIPAVSTYDYDMWLNLGQSNGAGTTENPWLQDPPTLTAGTFYEWDGDLATFTEKSGTPVRSTGAGYLGYWNGTGIGVGRGGYQSEFARRINISTGRKQLWVQYSPGGSGIVSGQTYSGGNWTDSLLASAITTLNNAITYCNANNMTFRLRGVIWQQGEQDNVALNSKLITTAQYVSALNAICNSLYSSFSSYYAPMLSGVGAFFNIFCNIGGYLSNSSQNWPGSVTQENYTIHRLQAWDLPNLNSLIKPICVRGPWLGFRGLLQADNTHAKRQAYDECGAVMALNMIDGSGTVVDSAPTLLAEQARTNANVLVSWTNNAATPRRIIIEQKLTSDPATAWQQIGAIKVTTQNKALIGIPKRGVSYDIRVGTWTDDGFWYSNTLVVTLTAPTIPADYFTASGVTGAYKTAIENCITALGSLVDDLSHFTIFRSGYNKDTGTVAYDIMRNADYTLTATGVTRNADHYATNGTSGDIYVADFNSPFVMSGYKTMMFWHKCTNTDNGNLWQTGYNATTDASSLIDEQNLSYRLSMSSGQYTLLNSDGSQGYQLAGQSLTTGAIADGTVRDICMIHSNLDGRQRFYLDGSGTLTYENTVPKRSQMYASEFGPRLGRVQSTFKTAKPSITMIFNRPLSVAEYQSVRTTVNTYIV